MYSPPEIDVFENRFDALVFQNRPAALHITNVLNALSLIAPCDCYKNEGTIIVCVNVV